MSHEQTISVGPSKKTGGKILLIKSVRRSSPLGKTIKMSPEGALNFAQRTGQVLGRFDTIKKADTAARARSRKSDRTFDVGDRTSPKRRLSGTGRKKK